MGVKIALGGESTEAVNYSVSEESTPLSPADSSGSVGTVSLEIRRRDDPHLIVGEDVAIESQQQGSTKGRIDRVGRSDSNDTLSLQGFSRLGELNIYNVQAQPFVGTLGDAFRYYLGLASINTELSVHPTLENRHVTFLGWYGELWYNLKQLAAAHSCEIALVSGVIVLRPLRSREAVRNKSVSRDAEMGGGSKALGVEIYQYSNRQITNSVVFPAFGVVEDAPVITIGAGEEIEYNLELSASVSSIVQPQFDTWVSPTETHRSVYCVVGDDGQPITHDQWAWRGGRLSVEINPDTTSLTVRAYAPTGLFDKDRNPINTFTIGRTAFEGENRYSALRILGTGIEFRKELFYLPTGLTPRDTNTEVGTTIDNPFIDTHNAMYSAGTRAARQFKGDQWSLSGEVTAVNKRGQKGIASYPTYGEVQSAYSGMTYTDVKLFESGAPQTNYLVDPDFQQGTTRYDTSSGWNLSLSSHNGGTALKLTGDPSQHMAFATKDWFTDFEFGDQIRATIYLQSPHYDGGTITFGLVNGQDPDNQRPIDLSTGLWTTVSAEDVRDGTFIEFTGASGLVTTVAYGLRFSQVGDAPVAPLYISDMSIRNLTREGTSVAPTYGQVKAKWFATLQDTFDNQVFGNVNGARVWDERSRRWYRVRSATVTPGRITFDATGDNTYRDYQMLYSGLTYADVKSIFSGMSYTSAERMGLFRGNAATFESMQQRLGEDTYTEVQDEFGEFTYSELETEVV